jgi:hypothetical protein
MTARELSNRRRRRVMLVIAVGTGLVLGATVTDQLLSVPVVLLLGAVGYAIAWLMVATQETSRSASWLYLPVGAAFGLMLSVPKLAASLVLLAVWGGGLGWFPLLSVPSFVYLRRRAKIRARLSFVTGAVITFTLILYLLVRSDETERNSTAAVGAWVAAWMAATVAPLSLPLVRRVQARSAA